MKLSIVNGRQHGFTGENKIYIGKQNRYPTIAGSPLANPFIIGKDGDRSQVILLYRKWLWSQIQDVNSRLEAVNLAFKAICKRDRLTGGRIYQLVEKLTAP